MDEVPSFLWDTHGAAWGDFDNDGDQDILLSVGGGRGQGGEAIRTANRVFVNLGRGFEEQGGRLGLADQAGRGRSVTWLDADNDGMLDAVLAKADPPGSNGAVLVQRDGTFRPCENALPGLSKDDSMDFVERARLFEWNMDFLLPHRYDFQTKVYAFGSGCRFEPSELEGLPKIRHVMDFAVADFDNDLLSEIFIATSSSHGGIAQPAEATLAVVTTLGKEDRFVEFSTEGTVSVMIGPEGMKWWPPETISIGGLGRHPAQKPFTLEPGESRSRGLADGSGVERGILIGYLPERDVWRIAMKSASWDTIAVTVESGKPIRVVAENITRPFLDPRPDVLLDQKGNTLVDVSKEFALGTKTSCHSAAAGDFDNDMDVDLYLVCGNAVVNLPNRLYENRGGHGFVDVSEGSGALGSTEGLGDKASVGDYDGDGFLDLFVTNGRSIAFNDGPHQLLRNAGNRNNWLELDLVGTISNRDAYGARAFVTAGGRTQMREKSGGTRSGVQDQQLLHFGLGRQKSIDEVLVQWPTGAMEAFPVDRVNARLVLREGEGMGRSRAIILLTAASTVETGEDATFLAVLGRDITVSELSWSLGDGDAVPGAAVMHHRFAVPGTYTVEVSALNVRGERVAASRRLVVEPAKADRAGER
jgi:hypothetical protein